MDGDSRKNPMIFVDVWKMQFPRTHTVNPEISSSWFFFLFTVKPRRDWKFTGRFTVFVTNSPAGTRRVFRKTGFYTKSWRLERNQTIFRLITFGSLPLSFSCSTDWQSIFSVSLLQTRSKNNRARLGQGKFTHADFPGKWLLNNQQASTRINRRRFSRFLPSHSLSLSFSQLFRKRRKNAHKHAHRHAGLARPAALGDSRTRDVTHHNDDDEWRNNDSSTRRWAARSGEQAKQRQKHGKRTKACDADDHPKS